MPNLATASATNSPSVENPGSITCQPPNLTIVKTPDGQTINAGDTATFTMVVTNTGPGTAAQRRSMTRCLPAGRELDDGLGWVRCGRGAGGADADVQLWRSDCGRLAHGGGQRGHQLRGVHDHAEPGDRERDEPPVRGDPGSITGQSADLSIVKTPDGQTINAGDTATFTMVVTNTAAGTARV